MRFVVLLLTGIDSFESLKFLSRRSLKKLSNCSCNWFACLNVQTGVSSIDLQPFKFLMLIVDEVDRI